MTLQVESKGNEAPAIVNGSQVPALREHDVVCEKGRGDHERWPGNKLYRFLINLNKESYNDLAPMERSAIIGKIINTIKEKDGWFVQRDEKSGKWGELTEEKIRKKVSDDLRREVRRRREKRSSNTVFSAKVKALKDMEEETEPTKDILHPVDDPRPADVLFGPGARRHPGNKTYWRLMKMNLDHYIISPYGARSMISRSIVQGIREQNGRFLEQDSKTAIWYEISDKRAIEKTSHALSNKKYKTRKRHPDDQDVKSSLKGYNGLEGDDDEDSDISSEKSSESPSPEFDESQSRAKVMSKKFRLLQRMGGPEFDDDDKESIPHAANILINAFPQRSSGLKAQVTGPPASPPISKSHPAARVVVSPNDSRSSTSEESREEYAEYEQGRFHRRAGPPRRLPSVPEASPELREYMYRKTQADMEPRLTRYETYVDDEHYHPERIPVGFIPSPPPPPPYAARMREYAPSTVRRYIERGLTAAEAEYVSPRATKALPSPSYAVGPPVGRRVLKARGGPPGYWVQEWASPTTARRAEDYHSWR